MKKFAITYPVTDLTLQTLSRFSSISKEMTLKLGERSPCEIVRIMSNPHYPHLVQLLSYIDESLSISEKIGIRLLTQTDPFEFEQNLAELFLLSSLKIQIGEAVFPYESPRSISGPDIEAHWQNKKILIEVFSPTDFDGFQRMNRYLSSLLKYLESEYGFHLKINIVPDRDKSKIYDQDALYYPYTIPDQRKVREWLFGFKKQFIDWLKESSKGEIFTTRGPGEKIEVVIQLEEKNDDPEIRQIGFTQATRSTDTSLFFTCGGADYTSRTQWGKKLQGKLSKRQCGYPEKGKLRMLVVNFTLADAGKPDFFLRENVIRRIDETIRLLATPECMEYDIVLPGNLGYQCTFGVPVWLENRRITEFLDFIDQAGLGRMHPVEEGI